MTWLGDILDRLSEFDRQMNSEVISSGILSGLKKGALAECGRKIHIKPGCIDVLKCAVHAGVPTAVVSVNWSSELIQASLQNYGLKVSVATGHGGVAQGVEGNIPLPGTVLVYANELEYSNKEERKEEERKEEKGKEEKKGKGYIESLNQLRDNEEEISNGNILRRCECAADKGRIFDDILLSIAADALYNERGISVYIGDSLTDLPALISADVGIVMGNNQLIRHVIACSGIPLRSLVTYPIDPGNVRFHSSSSGGEESEGMPKLYEANGWEQVGAFLFGEQILNK